MAKTREIKKRLKAVGNIKRITRTMQMIATSKFAKAQQRTVGSQPYSEALFQLVSELGAGGGDQAEHPILSGKNNPKEDAKELTLVLTSDRGLCGAYNASILREALKFFRSRPEARNGIVELVGKKGVSFFKFNDVPVTEHHTIFGDDPQFEDVARLAQRYTEMYMSGEIKTVRIVYMHYISAGRQTPEIIQLLPLKAEKPESAESDAGTPLYEFSPSAPELLDVLLPAAIKAMLFQAFLEAVLSEHVGRMVAMKAATDNAGKMGKSLTRQFNRARQAQITTELTEIISGAAALG